jgi:hypothetical protein
MTAVLRGAMPVAPLHAIRAHSPGTGKSFYVDVVSTVATGRPCPVITAGRNQEEMEKRLGALIREGVAIVSIDNVTADLGGDLLCQLTECPRVQVRILGLSEAPEFECKASVFATGNNLTLVGDMTRRAIICSLDAKQERPELRRFKSDPVAEVLENRGVFVAAILTISMAYRAAGCPSVCDPLGSYGEWTQLVRAPLIWLGEKDPVKTMEVAREEDPELSAIRAVFAHLEEHIGLSSLTTAFEVSEIACAKDPQDKYEFKRPEFRDALLRAAGQRGTISTRALGRWLARVSGRIVGNLRLNKTPDPVHGHKYLLERLSDDPSRVG